MLEPLQEKMGDRFMNIGLAEQSMIGISAGLALSGKKVYTYTMCAFYLRCIEQIRNDLCYQELPVTMLGVGVGYDYEYLGATHYALEDEFIISALRNIDVVTPYNSKQLELILKEKHTQPRYIRLGKGIEEGKRLKRTVNYAKYPHYGASKEYLLKNDYANKEY
jgi:transketolase